VHRTDGWRPPHFVDELTGVYGRPTIDGGLLLGVPTPHWDVDPDHPPIDPELPERAAAAATARFPDLRLGAVIRRVAAADCYTDPPGLALRPVDGPIFTFTGGSGGSVKTALAASARAADDLVATVAAS
jgi:glycine/D-amino acid oxidase-like deaminating enzyme